MEEAQLIKSFNQGYILAQYAPTLMDSLKPSADQNNDYLQGMLSGSKQYDQDKVKEASLNKEDKTQAKDSKSLDQEKER